jgi:hypothetical protein
VKDAELFFANRVAHAFNTVWSNLLRRTGTGGRADGSTHDGLLPFKTADDFATPSEASFARCDAMLGRQAPVCPSRKQRRRRRRLGPREKPSRRKGSRRQWFSVKRIPLIRAAVRDQGARPVAAASASTRK